MAPLVTARLRQASVEGSSPLQRERWAPAKARSAFASMSAVQRSRAAAALKVERVFMKKGSEGDAFILPSVGSGGSEKGRKGGAGARDLTPGGPA